MIRLENISKSFRSETVETKALQRVNLEVRKGEFIAVMGPSGCGKTTLLNILGLLNTPDSGRYFLDGRDVSGLKERDRLKLRRGVIGFVFQSFNLIDDMNVFENVGPATIRSSSPAGSSSVSPWPGRSSPTRSSSSATSPPAISTATTALTSCTCFATSTPPAPPSSWSPTAPTTPASRIGSFTCSTAPSMMNAE